MYVVGHPSFDGQSSHFHVYCHIKTIMFKRTRLPYTDSLLAIFLLLLSFTAILDLALDDPEDLTFAHMMVEGSIFGISLTAFFLLINRIKTVQSEVNVVSRQLSEITEQARLWKRRAGAFVEGLGREIELQFREWGLTPMEQEVALLLLKGFSLQEIAHLFKRSERTVRQHAGVIYQKSNLSGRAELSAFFLEDLLVSKTKPSD